MYAPAAWKQERASWRAVIQLNVVRSIITIVDTLQAEMDGDPISPTPLSPLNMNTDALLRPSTDTFLTESSFSDSDPTPIPLTEKHQLLSIRLGPLRRVEARLRRRLGAGTHEIVGRADVSSEECSEMASTSLAVSRSREFGVRGLQDALRRSSKSGLGSYGWNGPPRMDETTEIIASFKEDMKTLWMDPAVRETLWRRRMRMEDSAGFFLNDLERIATRTYEPSDDDVVRARLRTLGVQEYRLKFEHEPGGHFFGNTTRTHDFGREWILYDVGGSRTQRHAWLPYFDNVNAIIFLAPVSCFDERLLEDPSVNRLEDSFLLWRAICSSKLIAKATMILFLNKCDLLKRKLKSGTQVRHFLPSYGSRANEATAVVKYLRDKFRDILRQRSPEPRTNYVYATSVIDTRATATTLITVRDSILREHLKNAEFV